MFAGAAYTDLVERPAFLQVPGAPPPSRTYSEETSRDIDHAVRKIVHAAFDKTQAVLTERRETLERGARQLLEKETLVEDDLRALVGRPKKKHPTATRTETIRGGPNHVSALRHA